MNDPELKELCTADFHLLHSLPEDEREELVRNSVRKTYRKNSYLFRQGEPVNDIFVIIRGSVKLTRFDPDGNEQIMGIFKEYSTIWEGMFIENSRYPYSAICLEHARVCIISREQFSKTLQDPEAAMHIIGLLSHKLHNANERVAMLSAKEPKKRIAGFLLYWIEHNKEDLINLKLDDIAGSTNMRPETVSRKVHELEDEGIISREGQSGIRILDFEKLQKIYEL